MNVGIVGHEAAKFTEATKKLAENIIIEALSATGATLVSGHCHLGGIDIWAEEIAELLGREQIIYPPSSYNWSDGYKPRNIKIAQKSDIVHVIVVAVLPDTYTGMRFHYCYHCNTNKHVKSGGCWTAKYAQKLGKPAIWHVVE